jgi:hypothetical protein
VGRKQKAGSRSQKAVGSREKTSAKIEVRVKNEKLMVGKGGLPPRVECHSILSGGKPPFPTMRFPDLTLRLSDLNASSVQSLPPRSKFKGPD